MGLGPLVRPESEEAGRGRGAGVGGEREGGKRHLSPGGDTWIPHPADWHLKGTVILSLMLFQVMGNG